MGEDAKWRELAGQVLDRLRAGDAGAAFALLDAASADAAGPPQPFREVARVLYWTHHAIAEYVTVVREYIRRVDAAVPGISDPTRRAEWVRPLGGANYNLAADLWPGWGDPNITLGPVEIEVGEAAARRCLAIREDPANGDVNFGYTPSMAHWVVGAFALVKKQYAAARERFAREAELERNGKDSDVLARGYLALASVLEHPGEAAAEQGFEAVLAELAGSGEKDHGFYREQLMTARRVLSD